MTQPWHERIPRDPIENLKWRRWFLQRCDRPADGLQLRRDALKVCLDDPIFWINAFVFQFNPQADEKGKVASLVEGPFITWPFQDEALLSILDHISNRKPLVIEKSRDMGASWLCLLAMDWRWMFGRNNKFFVVSKSEEAVDKPDEPDSLFWKLDYIHRNLPRWMQRGRIDIANDGTAEKGRAKKRKKRTFFNPLGHNFITGAAMTELTGVGGRATAIFADEHGYMPEDWALLQNTANTAKCVIFNSTHNGLDKAFYHICTNGEYDKIQMHWSQHPDKVHGLYRVDRESGKLEVLDKQHEFPPNYPFVRDGSPFSGPHPGLRSPWYDAMCKRIGNPQKIAMDLDINPQGSEVQVYDAGLVESLIRTKCRPADWEGDLRWDSGAMKWDFADSDDGLVHLELWVPFVGDRKVPSGIYFFGADLSQGTGTTPSCLSIMNSRGEKVGLYSHSRLDPKEFAELVYHLAQKFKDEETDRLPTVCWETGGPGGPFFEKMVDLGYTNLWQPSTTGHIIQVRVKDSYGFNPGGGGNKGRLHTEYQNALRHRKVLNPDEASMRELLKFKWKNGIPEHAHYDNRQDTSQARQNHGDRATADAIAWWIAAPFYTVRVAKESTIIPVNSIAGRRAQARSAVEEYTWRR